MLFIYLFVVVVAASSFFFSLWKTFAWGCDCCWIIQELCDNVGYCRCMQAYYCFKLESLGCVYVCIYLFIFLLFSMNLNVHLCVSVLICFNDVSLWHMEDDIWPIYKQTRVRTQNNNNKDQRSKYCSKNSRHCKQVLIEIYTTTTCQFIMWT